jgi:hypothetical protein
MEPEEINPYPVWAYVAAASAAHRFIPSSDELINPMRKDTK